MPDLRHPVMSDVSFESEARQPERGFKPLSRGIVTARSLQFEKRQGALQRAVEFEIVPRLVMADAFRAPPGENTLWKPDIRRDTAQVSDQAPKSAQASAAHAFAELILGPGHAGASAHIQSLRDQGQSLEKIYLELIAPAAKLLRQFWLDDQRDFADVTLGFWRLQQLLREFSAAFRDDAGKSTGLRALLAPAPGETHELGYLMFGLVLVGEFFRRDGWDTWIEPDSAKNEMVTLISSEWFDVVEIMVSNEKRLETLATRIKTIRGESLNRALGVVVCGPMFVEHPELALLVGGDMPAADPRDGVVQARLLASPPKDRAK